MRGKHTKGDHTAEKSKHQSSPQKVTPVIGKLDKLRSLLIQAVAATLHRRRQLIRTLEGGHKQRNDQGNERLAPQDIAFPLFL